MAKYQKVGGGGYGVYRKRKSNWGGWVLFGFAALVVIGAIAG
ncbi:MAG: hypothetical protein AAF668_06570 [Pseudomonadota bacterium]